MYKTCVILQYLQRILLWHFSLTIIARVKANNYWASGFAIGLVNSVINLPDGRVNFVEEFKLQKNCEINLLIKAFLGLVEMIFGLVYVSFSLPKWQAVKMFFFAPCFVEQCSKLMFQLITVHYSVTLCSLNTVV